MIDEWLPAASTPDRGGDRLTAEILQGLPGFHRDELLTETVACTATRSVGRGPRSPRARRLDPVVREQDGRIVRLDVGDSKREQGCCHLYKLPPLVGETWEGFSLWEDGTPLGPPQALHDTIRREGAGAHCIWDEYLYFATSDNSDPNLNGRRYSLRPRPRLP